jgi:riboflavin kinase/FMN adenylyltransferase
MNKALRINFQVLGRVIHGAHYGKKLGFPTANIDRRDYSRRGLKIKLGIYAGWAESSSGKKHRAAIVIGPLEKTGLPKIEAHLLNFRGNLYGKKIILSLGKYIRPFRKFKNEAELRKQIQQDIINIEKINLYAGTN